MRSWTNCPAGSLIRAAAEVGSFPSWLSWTVAVYGRLRLFFCPAVAACGEERARGSAPQRRSAVAAGREHAARFRSFAVVPGHDPGRAVTILNIGPMSLARDQVAAGVGDDVTLAPLDPNARIVAGKGRVFSGFPASAVDHTGCLLLIAAASTGRVRSRPS